MTPKSSNPDALVAESPAQERAIVHGLDSRPDRADTINRLRLLWAQRRFVGCVTLFGLIATTVIALLTPSRYTSTVRLMPPACVKPYVKQRG